MERFKTIVISRPEIFEGEGRMIEALIEEGIDHVHIRKPEASEEEVRRLIETISEAKRETVRPLPSQGCERDRGRRGTPERQVQRSDKRVDGESQCVVPQLSGSGRDERKMRLRLSEPHI